MWRQMTAQVPLDAGFLDGIQIVDLIDLFQQQAIQPVPAGILPGFILAAAVRHARVPAIKILVSGRIPPISGLPL